MALRGSTQTPRQHSPRESQICRWEGLACYKLIKSKTSSLMGRSMIQDTVPRSQVHRGLRHGEYSFCVKEKGWGWRGTKERHAHLKSSLNEQMWCNSSLESFHFSSNIESGKYMYIHTRTKPNNNPYNPTTNHQWRLQTAPGLISKEVKQIRAEHVFRVTTLQISVSDLLGSTKTW